MGQDVGAARLGFWFSSHELDDLCLFRMMERDD